MPKDPNKIAKHEVVKVNRRWLLSMVESIDLNIQSIEKNGNAVHWAGKTPSECLRNIAEAIKKEALK